jgi:hypothetical protein
MSSARFATIAERKALLATRAELDRARVALAVHGLRNIVAPAPSAESLARAKPAAAVLVAIGSALLGAPRLGRWLRIGSLALAVFRIARSW